MPDHVATIAPPRLRRAAALLNGSPPSLGVSRRLLADLMAYEHAAARVTDAARDHGCRNTRSGDDVDGASSAGVGRWRGDAASGRLAYATASGVDAARLLACDGSFARALVASPTLAAAMPAATDVVPRTRRAEPRHAELVWVAKATRLDVPLEALVELLATALGEQFAEPVAVATLGTAPLLRVWNGGTLAPLPTAVDAGATELWQAFTRQAAHPERLHRLLVVHPGDPLRRPPPFARACVHRVVYFTDEVPESVPPPLREVIRPDACLDDGAGPAPWFSSFVSIVIVPSVVAARRGASSFRTFGLGTDHTGTTVERGGETPLGRRLWRDSCVVPVDVERLRAAWDEREPLAARSPDTRVAFVRRACATQPALRAAMLRAARAMTNRRVGVALSGGGASAFRAVPLFEMLAAHGVPVDVVSGVSGGALVGAYYAHGGMDGLQLVVDRRFRIWAASLRALLDSTSIETQIDGDLGDARLEELPVRFVPVATELRDPPRLCGVVAGSVGEGVRVSGALPCGFGPTEKNGVRYADGATASMIPARVVVDAGADLVLACNCVPGPARANPLAALPGGDLLHRYTIVGRVIDAWISAAFLLRQTSADAAAGADVFWEPARQDVPLWEAFQFPGAPGIVAACASEERVSLSRCVDAVATRWRHLGDVS